MLAHVFSSFKPQRTKKSKYECNKQIIFSGMSMSLKNASKETLECWRKHCGSDTSRCAKKFAINRGRAKIAKESGKHQCSYSIKNGCAIQNPQNKALRNLTDKTGSRAKEFALKSSATVPKEIWKQVSNEILAKRKI